MNEAARRILTALNGAGYEAYIVGGAVRDILMKRRPHDYDIVTSARPEEVAAVAAEQGWGYVDGKGLAFGVSRVITGGESFEVAAFRSEIYGTDSHRPERIRYASTLREDVQRRDFTVNALAMDKDGAVYDYVGGRKDIKKKRLAAVGDPAVRFREDALRLFRLCRFAGQLDFVTDKATVYAMEKAFPRVAGLSVERVVGETERLLVTPAAYKGLDILVRSGLGSCSCRRKEKGVYREVPILPELAHLPETPQSRPYHVFDAWNHTLAVVAHTPADLTLRYAALFHDMAKGLPGIRGVKDGRYADYGHDREGARLAAEVMRRWGCGKYMTARVAWLVKTHMKFHYFANTGQGDVNKWLRREALGKAFHTTKDLVEAVRQAAVLAAADAKGCRPDSDTGGTESFGEYMAQAAVAMPVGTKDLDYDRRVPTCCGCRTGDFLRDFLRRVQNGHAHNDADTCAAAAYKWMKRHGLAEDANDKYKKVDTKE